MRTSIQIAKAIIKEISQHDDLIQCKSFSELHDHCDANCLGGTEEDKLIDSPQWGEFVERLDEAQTMVSFYLSLVPSDRKMWLNQIDNQYFNSALIRRMQDQILTCGAIALASEIADLNLVIHDLRSELLKNGLMKELEEDKNKGK